jgi:hypothetical protein
MGLKIVSTYRKFGEKFDNKLEGSSHLHWEMHFAPHAAIDHPV